MKPMPISADTAVKLAAFMKVPIEHLMHMPQHIMLQKLAEMAMAGGAAAKGANGSNEAETGSGHHVTGEINGESGNSENKH